MKRSLINAVSLLFLVLTLSVHADSSDSILAPVKNLNKGLSERDTNAIQASFSDEFEWENSYGWTIRTKEGLVKFFDEWMFKQYPKSSRTPDVKYTLSRLSGTSAWVDSVQHIQLGDNVVRIRQVHLLLKIDNHWKISKTRIWRLRHTDNPPTDYVKELDIFEN